MWSFALPTSLFTIRAKRREFYSKQKKLPYEKLFREPARPGRHANETLISPKVLTLGPPNFDHIWRKRFNSMYQTLVCVPLETTRWGAKKRAGSKISFSLITRKLLRIFEFWGHIGDAEFWDLQFRSKEWFQKSHCKMVKFADICFFDDFFEYKSKSMQNFIIFMVVLYVKLKFLQYWSWKTIP